MKVAIIGGTGFVGSYIIDALVATGHTPRALVRKGSEDKLRFAEHCERIPGDVQDERAVAQCMEGTQAAIYNAGLLREFPDRGITFEEIHYRGAVRAIDAARAAGTRRFVLMSANGAKANGVPYQSTKYRAEQALRSSTLDWTIFRPTVIFGKPRGRMDFCTQLCRDMIKPPIPAPLFYQGLWPHHAGEFCLSPVFVEDVARCFVGSLTEPAATGKLYPLGGPDTLSWKSLIGTLGAAQGKRKLTAPMPAGMVKGVARVLDRYAWFPVTRDQLSMLLEGNVADGSDAFDTFDVSPTHFTPAALAYLRSD